MGLDMYLKKGKKIPRKNFNEYIDIEKLIDDENKDILKKYKKYIQIDGEYVKWKSLFKECCYWRKANAIHKWFVDNIQNGKDDCEYHEVKKEDIEKLLSICKEVIEKTSLEFGKIKNGETLKDGQWQPIFEDGYYITNPNVARELLPTNEGFFFGSCDYDQYYLEDLKYTIKEFESILKYFDFDNNYLVYVSSW